MDTVALWLGWTCLVCSTGMVLVWLAAVVAATLKGWGVVVVPQPPNPGGTMSKDYPTFEELYGDGGPDDDDLCGCLDTPVQCNEFGRKTCVICDRPKLPRPKETQGTEQVARLLVDFEYASSRPGVGMRGLPPHVIRPLARYLAESGCVVQPQGAET